MKKEYLKPAMERISFVGKSDVCQNVGPGGIDPTPILPPILVTSPTI